MHDIHTLARSKMSMLQLKTEIPSKEKRCCTEGQ